MVNLEKLRDYYALKLTQSFDWNVSHLEFKSKTALALARGKSADIIMISLLRLEVEYPLSSQQDFIEVINALGDLAEVQKGAAEYLPGEAPAWFTNRKKKMPEFQRRMGWET